MARNPHKILIIVTPVQCYGMLVSAIYGKIVYLAGEQERGDLEWDRRGETERDLEREKDRLYEREGDLE